MYTQVTETKAMAGREGFRSCSRTSNYPMLAVAKSRFGGTHYSQMTYYGQRTIGATTHALVPWLSCGLRTMYQYPRGLRTPFPLHCGLRNLYPFYLFSIYALLSRSTHFPCGLRTLFAVYALLL